MAMNADQLREYIIKPVLYTLGMYSEKAENLVLGTACVESDCGEYIHQLGGGPALGIFQMEPATHDDIWLNYLYYREDTAARVLFSALGSLDADGIDKRLARLASYEVPVRAELMVGNLSYACALCRVHYWRQPEPIPSTVKEQGGYWKKYYNTIQGAGTVEKYTDAWEKHIGVPGP